MIAITKQSHRRFLSSLFILPMVGSVSACTSSRPVVTIDPAVTGVSRATPGISRTETLARPTSLDRELKDGDMMRQRRNQLVDGILRSFLAEAIRLKAKV